MIEFADLRDLPLFTGVEDASLSRAAAHAADVLVDQGQWIVREGQAAAFYVLLRGEYDLVKQYGDGQHLLAVRRERGEFLGEIPIVFGSTFLASARARTPCRLARFDREQFGVLVRESATLRGEIQAAIMQRVEGLERQASSPMRLPVVVGRKADPDCHGMRDFLSRNQVPFEWADPDEPWVAARSDLEHALAAATGCSVVLLTDGRILECPTPAELAVGVGLSTDPAHDSYDVVVVGGGPTG
ncbi:MAG: cyclic nucleotide-binding domain-containing protein, partial [Gaiellales bacterium]